MKHSQIIALIPMLAGVVLLPLAAHAEPKWIWISRDAQPNETAIFRKTFAVSGTVKSASLVVTCDNRAKATLNGKPAAESTDWKVPGRADVTKLLLPGENEIRIEGRNADGGAALIAVLTIMTADGKTQVVETGPDWQAAATGSGEFKPAVAIKKYGAEPWGKVLDGAGTAAPAATAPAGDVIAGSAMAVPPGFKVEMLYKVPKDKQGSWVSLTVDAKGRLIAGDQNGGLFRITVPAIGVTEGASVEPLKTSVGGAHGLLYAFESLYVMVNEKGGKGLWRLRDTDGDDQFDKADLLRKMEGGGEHGTHGLALGPDGRSIFFACGNKTKLPEGMEKSRGVAVGEDHLLPRIWDPSGHAKDILAPGGYIGKTDPDGKVVELFSSGFRNQYDIAFDPNGEVFTYDSDMEYDIGLPWYMPTRVNHAVSAGDYGWRSGSGRWPAYFADSLPAVVDIGPGSPTGVTFGTGAKFPAKYQRAFFASDWTYGTMYAIHLVPQGGSFRAEKEEFISGKPLPLTDLIIHPKDCAMYFLIGGRGTQSALYRVNYAGAESTAPAARAERTPEAKLRLELEKLHVDGVGAEAIDTAWPHLDSPDRFVRWAARVAIERQPSAKWAERALSEKQPQAAIEALIALARVGDKSLQPRLLDALGQIEFNKLTVEQRLPLLRAWQVALTRMGKPAPAVSAPIAAKLDALFPHPDPLINRELVALLVFLDSPRVVAKTVPLLSTSPEEHEEIATASLLARSDRYAKAVQAMQSSRPNRQAIAYAYSLRNATAGWTPELRSAFFSWFPRTSSWKGGQSVTKFIDIIRNDALAKAVPAADRAKFDTLSMLPPPAAPANYVAPKGPGKAWTVDEVAALAQAGLKGRNFEQGKAMFASTLCINCHRFGGEGGNIGPDLTGAGNRYTIRDLLENIIEPSKVVSDQYGSEQIETKDGGLLIGRVVKEEGGKLSLMSSPLAPDILTTVNGDDVKSRKPYPVSMMPAGLVNSLNQDEMLDLLAYIQSAGNPKDKAFAK